MTNLVRNLAIGASAPLGLAANWLREGARILMYHRVRADGHPDQLSVSPACFAEQMRYLAAHWRVMPLSALLDALDSGALPDRAVALTFDDGYRDNLLHAWPVLRDLGLSATFFVTSEFCDQSRRHPRYAGESRLHLSWDEVRQLAAEPGAGIGSHTLTHPRLQQLPAAEAAREIASSRGLIAANCGRPVEFFCYPSGDAGEREFRMTAEAGYRAAVTVAPGANRSATPRMQLHRTEVTERDDPRRLALKLHGAFDPAHAWLHRRRMRNFARAAARP